MAQEEEETICLVKAWIKISDLQLHEDPNVGVDLLEYRRHNQQKIVKVEEEGRFH